MRKKEQQIFSACTEKIRSWQTEEKSYILTNQSLIEMLVSWYKSNLSDGCWTAGNLLFVRQLARLSLKNINSTETLHTNLPKFS